MIALLWAFLSRIRTRSHRGGRGHRRKRGDQSHCERDGRPPFALLRRLLFGPDHQRANGSASVDPEKPDKRHPRCRTRRSRYPHPEKGTHQATWTGWRRYQDPLPPWPGSQEDAQNHSVGSQRFPLAESPRPPSVGVLPPSGNDRNCLCKESIPMDGVRNFSSPLR